MYKNEIKVYFDNILNNIEPEGDLNHYLKDELIKNDFLKILFEVINGFSTEKLEYLFSYEIKRILPLVSKVLIVMEYSNVKKLVPYYLYCFQDINWQGAGEVLDFLDIQDKEILIPSFEDTFKKAKDDVQWLYFFIEYLLDRGFTEDDFSYDIRPIYKKAINIYERDS